MAILSFGWASLGAQGEPQHVAPQIGAQSGLPTIQAVLDRVPPERLALLARGINLNSWFTSWSNPSTYATWFRPDEAAFLKRAGFTVCRLPLAPDLLFDPADPARPKAAIRYVDRAVRMLLGAGLAVVFDPIHGASSSDAWESEFDHDPSFLTKVEVYWESLASHFAALSADRIFFEVMNEPHLSAREKVDPSWWQSVQEALAAAIRRGAPSNTIIATGEKWGGIDGLLALKPLADRNIVYSFHCYDPFTFTHQVPVFCGEFGVYRKVAQVPDRLRWIGDVRRSLESLGIGWSMWDYETDFGLVTYREPSWRRGIEVDSGCLAALGLDASATIAPRLGEATLSDFVSGKVRTLDMPVEVWTRLWTRENGSGETAVVSDNSGSPLALALSQRGSRDWSLGSGLRVPVRPGEELRLSSRAPL